MTFYSFRNEDGIAYVNRRKRNRPIKRSSISNRSNLNSAGLMPITCFDIARDSQLAAVASNKSIEVLQLTAQETTVATLEGHSGLVTCINFSPNCEFIASGSEDKTVNIWGLTLGLVVTTFKVIVFTYYCYYYYDHVPKVLPKSLLFIYSFEI